MNCSFKIEFHTWFCKEPSVITGKMWVMNNLKSANKHEASKRLVAYFYVSPGKYMQDAVKIKPTLPS